MEEVAQWCASCFALIPIIRQIKSGRMRWVGHIARMGEKRKSVQVFEETEMEGRRPFERKRRRWENEIRTDLMEIPWRGVKWIQLGQGRERWRTLVNAMMSLSGSVAKETVLRTKEFYFRLITLRNSRRRGKVNFSRYQNKDCKEMFPNTESEEMVFNNTTNVIA
jgi:hypothetical protein